MTHDSPLLAAWHATLSARGKAPAILDVGGGTLRSFAEIEVEAGEFSALLADAPERGVIGIRMGNDPRLPALLLALWRRNLVPVLLGNQTHAPELEAALRTAGASGLIELAGSKVVLASRAAGGAAPDADFLKLTSGTTGAPRVIRFRAAQLLADCAAVCDTMGICEGDLNFGAIPWAHSYGFSNLITPLLCRGVPVVATEDRLPRALLDGLRATGATVFPGLPVFFNVLASTEAPPLPKLRLCISAGAPLSAATARRFRERFGLKLHSFYGSSECGGIAYDATDAEVPEGCVGQAMRGVEWEFVSDGGGTRLAVKSAAVGEGYWPEEDASVLNGGVFRPSDLVEMAPSGLTIAGRASDVINVAGRKLNPLEVESRLRLCPGVREAVVFGVPSALRGEEPVACVVGEPALDAAEILRFCAAALSPWQTPKDVWMVTQLPVNERGKLSRRALAAAYAQR